MAKQSAGLLVYRFQPDGLEVLLVHPGGPFFKKKDEGAWSIPKGELDEGEEGLHTAIRELEEETGYRVKGPFIALSPIKQKGGKTVQTWAAEGDFDTRSFTSNTFTIEWPPRSGRQQAFSEVDKVEWFKLNDAARKINPAQAALLTELVTCLNKS